MMSTAKHVGRIGALAVALGVGFAVAATPAVGYAESTDSGICRPADSAEPGTTALIMGGGTLPTPDHLWVETVKNQFIAPTHPEYINNYCAVTAPMEVWPLTGLLRVLGLALGAPSVFGLGGPAWPDEPWWKLSGLFDLTGDQSIQAGVADLEVAMADHPNDHLVIYGYSQAAAVANAEKQRLAAQYPVGTQAPDIDFVLGGDFNVPNGGLFARFPGLYVPILDWSFNGPEPTNTQFDTVVITRQYDGFADFPLYPLNFVADVNAVLGVLYVHTYPFDVSLPPDPTKTSPAYQDHYGDTDYYFFENPDLPLFGPLRTLGVPEPVIDVVEPFFREIVELGYDRSIKPWQPTPARLIPKIDPAKLTTDLVDAIGEGINNAAALIGSPAPLTVPAAPATADQDAVVEQVLPSPGTALKRVGRDGGGYVSQVLTAVGSQLAQPRAVIQVDRHASQGKVGQKLPAFMHRIKESIGAVKSVIGNGRTIMESSGDDIGSPTSIAGPARKTPARDALKEARSDVNKVVTKVSDSIKKALSGKGDDIDDIKDGDEDASR